MRLILIRHGETDWNSERRIQGHSDTPLNARGIEQAEQLAARVASEEKIDALYASPLARARVTAEIVARQAGVVVIPDDRLKEKSFGELEGLSFAEIEQRFPNLFRQWSESATHLPLPGEEILGDFQSRVQSFLDDIRAQHNDDARIAVVTHGGTINMMLNTLIGYDINKRWAFWFDNASLSRIELTNARARIHLLNDTCHLRNGKCSGQ
jgi:probable phosphoglycerate mutase